MRRGAVWSECPRTKGRRACPRSCEQLYWYAVGRWGLDRKTPPHLWRVKVFKWTSLTFKDISTLCICIYSVQRMVSNLFFNLRSILSLTLFLSVRGIAGVSWEILIIGHIQWGEVSQAMWDSERGLKWLIGWFWLAVPTFFQDL